MPQHAQDALKLDGFLPFQPRSANKNSFGQLKMAEFFALSTSLIERVGRIRDDNSLDRAQPNIDHSWTTECCSASLHLPECTK